MNEIYTTQEIGRFKIARLAVRKALDLEHCPSLVKYARDGGYVDIWESLEHVDVKTKVAWEDLDEIAAFLGGEIEEMPELEWGYIRIS